jgi:A/G-specific adenine glycosylase
MSPAPGPGRDEPRATAPDMLSFRQEVLGFYRRNRRAFPWRENITPYRVVVSEIMLQQTGVERVREKYEPFIRLLPDFASLASAPLTEIMTAWQGLGYNRRTLSLKRLAGVVMERHSGRLPRDRASLLGLPGVGEATAGAIMAFAFNMPAVFIETNIRRVFIHRFFPGKEEVSDRQIIPLVEAALDPSNPRDWYYALMDYGSALGRSGSNANRKSSHYSKQAPFAGSERELRGEVIRVLLARGPLSVDDIARAAGRDPDRLASVLDVMIGDGLVVREEEGYRIA